MRGVFLDLLKATILVGFFCSTLLLSLYKERVFVSPDENAAFFFADTFARSWSLHSPEPLNGKASGLVHPRSIAAMGDLLVPGSFLGLPLLSGFTLMFFGDAGALLVTPFLALLAVIAFRSSVKKKFADEALADLSALFLMLHPAFLYYSGRVMMHNVAFTSFLIFALYFTVAKPLGVTSRFVKEFRRLEFFLGGFMVGAALLIRTSEVFWVLPIFLGLLFVFRNTLGWRNILSALFGLGLMVLAIFGTNSWVYGSPFATGYSATTSLVVIENTGLEAPPSPQLYNSITSLLPFGFHPRAVWRNFRDYGVLLYPWMTIPAFLGFVLLAFRRFEKSQAWKAWTLTSILISIALVFSYGSWTMFDNPNPALITLGNSHVRYWLPCFVLAAPFMAYLLLQLWRGLSAPIPVEGLGGERPLRRAARVLGRFLIVLSVMSALVLNVHLVFFGHDGILASRKAMQTFVSKRTHILSHTESDAVIVVDRADKYLFPSRRVVVPLRSEATYNVLPVLVKNVPTYYFGITFPQTDLDYLNNEKLRGLGLKIELVEVMGEEALYKILSAS